MSRKIPMSRRTMIQSSALAAAAPMIVPSSVFGANAPSNRITVAAIGVGGQGTGTTWQTTIDTTNPEPYDGETVINADNGETTQNTVIRVTEQAVSIAPLQGG